MADIVDREGIGITVDRIDEIENHIESLTGQEIRKIRDNVKRVSQDLADGLSMRRTVEKAMCRIKKMTEEQTV